MNEQEIKELWDRVKTLCKKNQITHIEMCEKANIDLGRFKAQLARNGEPKVSDALAIARVLKVSVEYLITGTEKNDYKIKYENFKDKIERALSEE